MELLFNRKAAATLANLSAGGRLPHALLLEGPAGSGKKTAARLVAQMALCAGEKKPCGRCGPCEKVEKNIHPDVRYYTVPDGKRDFPIELVREIRQDAYISPNEGVCKVYIIDKAHAMNGAAQNALLKIIEEPPAFVMFLLLCENRSLMLPTILSRVTSIELEIPTVEQCVAALEKLSPQTSQTLRQAAAAGAGGNIGQALELLGAAKPSKAAADAAKLLETLVLADRYQSLKILAAYDKEREGLLQLLALLKEQFARLAAGRGDVRYKNRVSAMQAVDAAEAIETALRRAGQNVGISLLCACMVERIKAALQ